MHTPAFCNFSTVENREDIQKYESFTFSYFYLSFSLSIGYFIAELKLIGLRCPHLKGTEWGTVKVTDASV
jgi:hypothetical protein